MKESSIVKKILTYLRSLPNCKAIKLNTGAFGHRGTPDILAVWRGFPFLFEAKVPGGEPTKLQEHELAGWGQAGATAVVVTSLDDVIRALENTTGAPICREAGKDTPSARNQTSRGKP